MFNLTNFYFSFKNWKFFTTFVRLGALLRKVYNFEIPQNGGNRR